MDLNMMHAQLASLLRAIDHELTQLLPAVSLPLAATSAHDRLSKKLSNWERQLDLVVRNLSSEKHRLAVESQRVDSLPRDLRYRARQSVTDRGRNLDDALRAAQMVRRRLEQLFDRFGRPTGPEVVKALEKLTKGAYEQAELTRAVQRDLQSFTAKPSGPVIRGATPASGPDIMVSIAVLGRLLHILTLRLASGMRRGSGAPG